MNVKNCRKCGRLFNYISGQQICPGCREALEVKFAEVKDYIRENKNCDVISVSEACDVEEGQIRQWVREERLIFSGGIATGITCEVCGCDIATGRFCEKCKASMINSLSSAGRQPEVEQKKPLPTNGHESKMRFLNK